ncbi:MAG: hypothetical protein LBG44_09410 [Gemmatimonadota bacterium]|jgi:DNA-directed RNA polymerase subunit RPC12/RpoP|nr:hypothetical protein [Gemmatimonadota bacterium]
MADIPEGNEFFDEPGAAGPMSFGSGADGEGVVTWVCLRCGQEYPFDSDQPSPEECGRCSNAVFRPFFTHEVFDDAATDFEDSTRRDLRTDDPEGDAMPGDILDLSPD